MNQDSSLLSESPTNTWACDKAMLFPATNSCYRSRIYTSNTNINPLIASCDQIFSLVSTLKTMEYPEDCQRFFQDLVHEIRSFEHRAQIENYPQNIIVAARYALCCLLDETIAATAWGQKNNWSEKNLLSLFHNENYGGSRFFTIIERSLENLTANLHLLELLYLCLNFGFTGKYREIPHGKSELVAISNRLYQIIGQSNHGKSKSILIHESPLELQQNYATSTIPQTIIDRKKLFKITTATAILISSFIYLGINFKLSTLSRPVYETITQITKNKNENQL